jgi:hypothetical protein
MGIKSVWIIASERQNISPHFWKLTTSEHSQIRPTGTFLCLKQRRCQLVWVGMPGMRWENVVPLIHILINYRGIPFAVIIHCGCNNMDLVPCVELLFHVKLTIAIRSDMSPGTSLVWSSILICLSQLRG